PAPRRPTAPVAHLPSPPPAWGRGPGWALFLTLSRSSTTRPHSAENPDWHPPSALRLTTVGHLFYDVRTMCQRGLPFRQGTKRRGELESVPSRYVGKPRRRWWAEDFRSPLGRRHHRQGATHSHEESEPHLGREGHARDAAVLQRRARFRDDVHDAGRKR